MMARQGLISRETSKQDMFRPSPEEICKKLLQRHELGVVVDVGDTGDLVYYSGILFRYIFQRKILKRTSKKRILFGTFGSKV